MQLGDFGPGFEKYEHANEEVPVYIGALAFSPDGGTLAVGGEGPLRLVELIPQ